MQGAHPGVYGESGEGRDNLIAGWILVDGEQFLIVSEHVFGDAELHLREGFSLGVAGFQVDDSANVEHHVVVSLVLLVSVQIPVARFVVYFDIAHPEHSVYLDFSIEEIGPRIAVVQPWVDDFHLPMVGSMERRKWKQLVFPYIVK